MNRIFCHLTTLAALLGVSGTALAHPGHPLSAGLGSGLLHPVSGLDHLSAMMAVGLWAALAMPRRSALPVALFLLFMLAGTLLGSAGFLLPALESGIAASVLVMGLLLTGLVRPPAALVLPLIAVFALFHGNAHGVEMPLAASPALYGAGLLASTAMLHLGGLALGRLLQRRHITWAAPGLGVLASAGGAWLLFLG